MAEGKENNNDEFPDGPLTNIEIKRLRRMMLDESYRRRFRTTVKVWVASIGAAASAVVALKIIFWEFAKGLLK